MRFGSQFGLSGQVYQKVIVLFTGPSPLCSFTCEELLQGKCYKIHSIIGLKTTPTEVTTQIIHEEGVHLADYYKR